MTEKLWYKVWPEGVPKTVEIPEIPLHEVLRQAAKKFPNKSFIIYEDKKCHIESLMRILINLLMP